MSLSPPSRAGVTQLLALAAAAAAFTLPASARAQGVPEAGGGGTATQGPTPPVAPAVVSRDDAGNATVRAVRVQEPLGIDGNLDEAFYQSTPAISDLFQSVPDEGAPATERTEAWVGFDDENVYVSARIWDSAPEAEWVANEMRRDAASVELNDQFGVFLDTYYDRRNAVGFVVNPLGGFTDLQVMNEQDGNIDWNPISEIRTGRFENGWTVEMAFPFRSLRYRPGREQVWGIQLRRHIVRKNEWDHLTRLPLSVGGSGTRGSWRVSLFGTLVGIEPPPPSRQLDVKPYAISSLKTNRVADPAVSNDLSADVGVDVKVGITDNLTGDLTYNTDFAQVEVDEQQANLTQFSVFFPEKRDFFLEGQGIWEFGNGGRGTGQGGGGGPPGAASVSSSGRGRGGRSVNAPALFYSRRVGLENGQPVPILGGGRLTGKLGSFDAGAVAIRTDEEPDAGAQATTFTAIRLRRDVLARSSVGVLLEERSQSLAAPGNANRAYGVDYNFAFLGDAQVFGYFARTETEGLEGRDKSFRVRAGYRGDVWSGNVDHVTLGENFNPELGFVRRKNIRETNVFARWSPRFAAFPSTRQWNFAFTLNYLENDRFGIVQSRNRAGRVEIEFQNGDWLTVNGTQLYEHLDRLTTISGAPIPAGTYRFRDFDASYYFGPTRRFSGSVSLTHGSFYTGEVTSLSLARGRIEGFPQLSVEPSVEFNWIDLAELETVDGEFNQHVARTRVNYALSPRAFVSGLLQYNSGSETFGANVRLRWEWAPGSELFVVFTEDRTTDVLDRWSDLSGRQLVIKATRLLRL